MATVDGVLSRLLYNGLSDEADQHGRHGLAAWGRRLGLHKGDFNEFGRLSDEMVEYCLQDCRVTAKLIERLRQDTRKFHAEDAARMELEYDQLLRTISRHGFRIDMPQVEQLIETLTRLRTAKQGELNKLAPPTITPGKRPSYYSYEYCDNQPSLLNGRPAFPHCSTKTELSAFEKTKARRRLTKRNR